jgi:hypothetical protein
LLFGTFAGTLSTYLLDELQVLSVKEFGDSAYGTTIFAMTALGLIGTVPFMIKAGNLFD